LEINMKTIIVKAPFTRNRGGGELVKFDAGQHSVDNETAAHWYVQAHSEPAKAEKPKDKDADKGSK